jgi:hypothetical protein
MTAEEIRLYSAVRVKLDPRERVGPLTNIYRDWQTDTLQVDVNGRLVRLTGQEVWVP